jgi:hypothetical protein
LSAPAAAERYILWPYFKLELADKRLWVRDARGAAQVPCEEGLLPLLEAFSNGATVAQVRQRFAVEDDELAGLVSAGLLFRPRTGLSPPPARVALVSTMLRPGPPLRSFLEYHLRAGISRIYLFLEDGEDEALATAARYPQVRTVVTDEAFRRTQQDSPLWERFASHLLTEVMARQCLNAQTALKWGMEEGIDWVLHLDADELLWPGDQALRTNLGVYFARLPNDVGQVLFLNYEAVPETYEVDDHFRDVTLFKRPVPLCDSATLRGWLAEAQRRSWFVGYAQGKAAVRLAPGAQADSVHEFGVSRRYPYTVSALDPMVLHYARCGFARYRERYREQARPGQHCFGTPSGQTTALPAGAGAPRLGFDVRVSAAFREDAEAARRIYEHEVMMGGAAEVERLLARQLCVRQPGPRLLLDGAAGPALLR